VRKVLEEMLKAEDLLLPEPFPLVEWERDSSPAAPVGSESLVLEVNLSRVDPDYTPERMKADLNAEFLKDPSLTKTGREADLLYKGIEVTSVEQVPGAGQVQRYRVKTSSYQPPGQGLRAEDPRPTKRQVEAAVRSYFSEGVDSGKVKLSEPFPQVLTVGPRVASSLQADALVAIFISLLGIIFYVSLRFEFSFGLAGIVALIHDAMFSIGMMALADQFLPDFTVKFNLTEMAAVLSILGFSINDTIVLFDRVRENTTLLAKRRYTIEEIFDISINQTLLRTVWTSLTVFIVTVILLGFGGESVRGFAYLFAVGLLAGTYSTVFIASPVALWLHRRAQARRQALQTTGA
jgi:preprotein translocase SecF subunit